MNSTIYLKNEEELDCLTLIMEPVFLVCIVRSYYLTRNTSKL